jgi:K+/H+ antiporter YhaU regulatory subunit KhtT
VKATQIAKQHTTMEDNTMEDKKKVYLSVMNTKTTHSTSEIIENIPENIKNLKDDINTFSTAVHREEAEMAVQVMKSLAMTSSSIVGVGAIYTAHAFSRPWLMKTRFPRFASFLSYAALFAGSVYMGDFFEIQAGNTIGRFRRTAKVFFFKESMTKQIHDSLTTEESDYEKVSQLLDQLKIDFKNIPPTEELKPRFTYKHVDENEKDIFESE